MVDKSGDYERVCGHLSAIADELGNSRETIYGWIAADETLAYTSYAYDGNIAEGTITSADADTLSYGGAKGSPSASGTIGQTIEFLSNDEARRIVWLETVEGKQQLTDATWN